MIQATVSTLDPHMCEACNGEKQAPLAGRVDVGRGMSFHICQECGRDLANAIGFLCVREGGWSKLEPRRRKAKP